jgi:hypothetical protein
MSFDALALCQPSIRLLACEESRAHKELRDLFASACPSFAANLFAMLSDLVRGNAHQTERSCRHTNGQPDRGPLWIGASRRAD